jgi:hypothetical protein
MRGRFGVTEYLVLLKVDPKKIVNAIRALRDLPQKPGPGVDLRYVMNVFGTWDVAMWFNTDSYDKAVDFVDKNVSQTPGVVDVYTVPTFPSIKPKQAREATTKDETKEEPTEKNETDRGD